MHRNWETSHLNEKVENNKKRYAHRDAPKLRNTRMGGTCVCEINSFIQKKWREGMNRIGGDHGMSKQIMKIAV